MYNVSVPYPKPGRAENTDFQCFPQGLVWGMDTDIIPKPVYSYNLSSAVTG